MKINDSYLLILETLLSELMKLKEAPNVVPQPISTFLLHKDDYKIDRNYQRAPGIWEKWMEQYLIDTILRGYSIPAIFIHKRGNKKFIVDGQQRLRTIWKFHDDDLDLSEKYSNDIIKDNKGAKIYSKLSDEYQNRFERYPLPLAFLENYNDEEIRSTFKRLQTAKTLTPGEKLNAYPGKIVIAMRELGEHNFFKNIVYLGIKRYKNLKLAATLMFLESEGIKSISPSYIYDFFEKNPTIDIGSGIYEKVKRILNFLEKSLQETMGELSSQAWVISTYLLASNLLDNYSTKNQQDNFKAFLIKFCEDVANAPESGDTELIRFSEAVSKGTNNEETIKFRHQVMFRRFVDGYHPQELHEDRIFSHTQKVAIFRRDKGKCQICSKKLEFGNPSTHFHHIDPYIEGGVTEIEKGMLVCKDCHLKKIHGKKGLA